MISVVGHRAIEKLITKKINLIEQKFLLETDASVQFKYQYEIDELKAKLQKLH